MKNGAAVGKVGTSHVPAELLDRYASGEAAAGARDAWWAVESHLESCPRCRHRLRETVARTSPATALLLERVQTVLVAEVARSPRMEARRRRPSGRWAMWITPTLLPRLAKTILVVLAAVGLDLADEAGAASYPSLVLLLAPVAPLLAVAAAWSRRLDPAYELVVAGPRAGLDLVLRRTVAVLAVVIPVLAVAGALVGASPARWLLPCLAFTTGALALGESIGLHRAATGLALGWAVVVVGPSLASAQAPVLLSAASVPGWALVTVVVAVVLVVRRRAYNSLTSTR
jgi:Putative zinc-finger